MKIQKGQSGLILADKRKWQDAPAALAIPATSNDSDPFGTTLTPLVLSVVLGGEKGDKFSNIRDHVKLDVCLRHAHGSGFSFGFRWAQS